MHQRVRKKPASCALRWPVCPSESRRRTQKSGLLSCSLVIYLRSHLGSHACSGRQIPLNQPAPSSGQHCSRARVQNSTSQIHRECTDIGMDVDIPISELPLKPDPLIGIATFQSCPRSVNDAANDR